MLSRLPYAGDATIYTQVAFGLVAVVSRDLHQGQQWAVRVGFSDRFRELGRQLRTCSRRPPSVLRGIKWYASERLPLRRY